MAALARSFRECCLYRACSQKKVLVADDDPSGCRLLLSVPGKWGYGVLPASDGEEAWQVLQHDHTVRLAPVDWLMPEVTGLEPIKRIRERNIAPFHAVLITSRGGKQSLIEALERRARMHRGRPTPCPPNSARSRHVHRTPEIHPMNRILTLGFLLLLPVVLGARGENWPEFRGPTGQGIATAKGLPAEWSATKNIAWKKAVPGKGWSSPVVVDGVIYLTAAVANEAESSLSLRALALDARDGSTRWGVEVFQNPADKAHSKNSHASPTPIVEGRRLYVHFGHLGSACLDLDGKVLWRNSQFKYSSVHGNGGSPALTDDAMVFSCDGASDPFIVAIAKSDGKLLWRTSRVSDAGRKFSFSTPLVITVKGQKQIISPGSGVVCALDPKSGKEIWRVRYGQGYSVVPRPVFAHGLVFLSSGFDRANILAIRPDGQGDVTDTHVAWTHSENAPKTPSLLVVGDEIYAASDNGFATCLDAKTGKLHWSERLAGGFSASPVFADGKVFMQNEAGTGFVLKPGKTFEKLGENKLGEGTLASYAIVDNALFIRTDKSLFKIQAK